MNTEERDRLNTNELGQAIQVVGHRLEEHATKIVMAVCGILLVAAAAVWWSRQTSASAVKAWTLLESADNVEKFGEVADNYKGTPAGRWARLRASELYLQTGLPLLFTDRDAALQELKAAREGFEQLLAESSIDPAIQERALWGLALVLESTSEGDTTKAVEAYQRLLNDAPETYFKPFAEERIATLKKGGASEFYAWFSKENPKPSEARPKDPGKSELDSLLPDKSEFNLAPNLPKLEGSKTPGARDADAVPETLVKPESTPKTTPPAQEKPGDSKPGDSPTPQDDEKKPDSESSDKK